MRKYTYKNVFVVGLCVIGLTLSNSVKSSAQSGIASVHSGGRTASGEYARSQEMTAAHRSLPFGTKVRVTNHRPAVQWWSGSMIVVPSFVDV